MKKLSSRERLLRVFRQESTDRMPVRIWGVDSMFPSSRPSWKPLYEIAEEYEKTGKMPSVKKKKSMTDRLKDEVYPDKKGKK